MAKLIILIGIPCSGKSTWVKNNLSDISDNAMVVSPDDIRRSEFGDVNVQTHNRIVWNMAEDRALKILNAKYDCVLDATNVNGSNRSKFITNILHGLKDVNVDLIAVVFEVDLSVAKYRLIKDIENGIDRANVPEETIDRMFNQLRNGKQYIEKNFDKVYWIK